MKTHSRTILYTMKENDVTFPLNVMMDRCKYTIVKLSYFQNYEVSLKYSTHDGNQIQLISIAGMSGIKNMEDVMVKYILERLNISLPHDLREIN